MASNSITGRVGAALPFIGIVLALVNWNATPAAGRAWIVAIVLFLIMIALRHGGQLVARRWSKNAAVNAAVARAVAGVNTPIVFAALLMIVSLSTALARAYGVVVDRHIPRIAIDPTAWTRVVMIACGAYLSVMGNRVPRMLPAVSSNQRGAEAQAFHRFVGWTWVLCGLGWMAMWLVLPIAVARTMSMVLAGAAMIATAVQLVRLVRHALPHARA